MSRGNDSANTTASQQATIRPIVFTEFRFDSQTLYLHNGVGRYQWPTPVASPAETWVGVGIFGQISEIRESAELTPTNVTFTLNGLDSTTLGLVDDEDLYERIVIIYLGYIGDDGQLTANPDERWRGFMDSAKVSGGEITLNCETELARLFRANGKRFTDEDQQAEYSGDTGFSLISQMINPDIRWSPNGPPVSFQTHGFGGYAEELARRRGAAYSD